MHSAHPVTPAIELREVDGGCACTILVRTQPGAKRPGFAGTWNGMLKIAVSAPADKGRANESLVLAIAELFEIPRRAVTLVVGERTRVKKFRLEASPARLRARLAEILAP